MNYVKWILFVFIIVANGQVPPTAPNLLRNQETTQEILQCTSVRADASALSASVLLLPKKTDNQHDRIEIRRKNLYLPIRSTDHPYFNEIVKILYRFIIENITASVDTLDVSLTLRFPTLVSDNYKLKGWAYYFYPLRGSGKMQLVFRNSVITAKAHFGKIKDGGTVMEDFVLIFDENKIEANLENSSWPINAILNSKGVEILDGYRSTLADALKNHLVPTVNDYFTKIPPAQLMQITS